jgi:2-polyprenyl-3-methyl-5-hydroxy-6-metoxy-1,4-benzoquinol methylase
LLVFIEPVAEDIKEYYQTRYRNEHDAVVGERLTPEERFVMMRTSMEEPANRIGELVPEGSSILEIGCSSGYMLDALQNRGYDVYGAEWNPEDAAFVREAGEVECEEGTLKEIYPGKTFNAIVALQVMEHQADPLQFLRDVKDKLIGGGYIYMEVPNLNDALLTVYGIPEYKNFYFREPHVTYWGQHNLAKCLSVMGYEAKISTRQRYSLSNHLNWVVNHVPMDRFDVATSFMKFVNTQHPAAPYLNRITAKLDKEYRTQLEALGCADTIVAKGRIMAI